MLNSDNLQLNLAEDDDHFDPDVYLNDNFKKIDEYISKVPIVEEYVATDGQTTFTLNTPYVVGGGQVKVEIDNVTQSGFTEVNPTTISFAEGLPKDANVRVTLFQNGSSFSGKLKDVATQLVEKATVVNVESFPVISPETDDTMRIRRAIAELKAKGGGVLEFARNKSYKITSYSTGGLQFTDMENFEVRGNGALIYTDPYLVDAVNNSTRRMLFFKGCKHFSVHGLRFKLQVDFNSVVDTTASREDHFMFIYSYAGQVNEDFDIYNNSFEYVGPQLYDPVAGDISRLSTLLIGSDTNIAPDSRLTNNFRVYGNTFKNCVGRTVYLLLARNGAVFGNTYEELGKVWYPNGDKGYGNAIAVRVLGSKNITVTGNVINAYSGELVNYTDKGAVMAFVTGQGVTGGLAEDIVITGNTFNFNSTHGSGLELMTSSNVTFHSNNIVGNETNTKGTYGVRFLSGNNSKGVSIKSKFKHCKIMTSFEDPTTSYSNITIDGSEFIVGTNNTVIFESDADTKAFIGMNYFSDKQAFCRGRHRQRIVYADTVPPTTGTFTVGDICYNTRFDFQARPVVSWIYQFNSGGVNYWRVLESPIFKTSTDPTVPTDATTKQYFQGLMFLDTSAKGTTDGKLAMWNSQKWVWADGTARP